MMNPPVISIDICCLYSNIAQKQETKICTYDENNNERQIRLHLL